MSYLSGPRLVFAGQFQADVSTVNNDPTHFDNATFQPNDQLPGQGATNGWWNPTGTGAWRLIDCTVKSVVYADGTTCDDPSVDPVVGASIQSVNKPFQEAKLVDLDSEQQMVSEIWALKVNLVATGMGFTSSFATTPFFDIYSPDFRGGPDSYFGAGYQSVLQGIQWQGAGGSRFLKEISAGGAPSVLSIKFNVSGFNDSHTPIRPAGGGPPIEFAYGKVVGSIGACSPGEPYSFVAGRPLAFSASALSDLQSKNPGGQVLPSTAYALVADGVLSLDLGNALYTESPGGPHHDFGPLVLAVMKADGTFSPIGAIPYTNPGWLESTAGIVSFRLGDDQIQAASGAPLVILARGVPLFSEASDGVFVRADYYVFRLYPGDAPAITTFTLLRFGEPWPGQEINVALAPNFSGGPPPFGTPTNVLSFPSTVTTGSDGTATLEIAASDPGNPRGYIDGQVYSILYWPGPDPPDATIAGNPSRCLNVLAWSNYVAPATPTWANDVEPIFQQYANLYPVMKPYVDLASKGDVVAKAAQIQGVFGVAETEPSYMPVTRDLSPAKKAMILAWLANPDHP